MSPEFGIFLGVLITLGLFAFMTRLTGFRTQKPGDFAANGPNFDMRQHLDGKILCKGVICGTLADTFRYDTGVIQDRCWTLRLDNAGRIRADLLGSGTGTQ